MEALQFRLDEELFAIDLAEVDEILMMASIRTLPDAPDFLAGVLNLRDQMIPVVDLSRRLGFDRPPPPPPIHADEAPQVPYRRNTRLIVTTVGGLRVAMIVDGLEEIRTYEPEEIRSSVVGDGPDAGWLDRLTVHEGEVIQLVHIRNALRDEEISMLRNG